MKNIKRIKRKINSLFYKKFKNRIGLRLMRKVNDPNLEIVRNAIISIIKNRLSDDELLWIKKIENLRNDLNASTTEIEFIDYGAGSSDIELTTNEMYEGRSSTEVISNLYRVSIPPKWGLLMLKIIKNFKPTVLLELGTCLGISSSYQASALEMNKKGYLTTIEGDPTLASRAKENFEKLGLKRVFSEIGRFQDVLERILNNLKQVNFAFIDGHHDEHATLNYFRIILPYLSENAILIFDDIEWSSGMKRAWNALKKDQHIKFTINLFDMGICVISSTEFKKRNFKIHFN